MWINSRLPLRHDLCGLLNIAARKQDIHLTGVHKNEAKGLDSHNNTNISIKINYRCENKCSRGKRALVKGGIFSSHFVVAYGLQGNLFLREEACTKH